MADASQNKPIKEFSFAIIGIVLFLAIVLLIAVSAYLRPAGDHVVVDDSPSEVIEEETTDEGVAEAEVVEDTVIAETTPGTDVASDSDVVAETEAVDEAEASAEGPDIDPTTTDDVATDTAVEENVLPPKDGNPQEVESTEALEEAADEVKKEKADEL